MLRRAAQWFLAPALLLMPVGTPATAASKPLAVAGLYKVKAWPFEILPWDTPVGETRTIRDGELVFEAPLALSKVATVSGSVSLQVGGMPHKVSRSDLLAAADASGGALGPLAKTAAIFCAPEERGRRVSDPVNGVWRYETLTQLCLVDADKDGRFEQAFMSGTKQPADQALVPITPLAYRSNQHMPMGRGYRLGVRYYSAGLLRSPAFTIFITVAHTPHTLSWYRLGDLAKGRKMSNPVEIKRKLLPHALNVLGTDLTILSVDEITNTAVIRFDRPPPILLLDFRYIVPGY